MKILVKNQVVIFGFDDNKFVLIKDNGTVVGQPDELHIPDCNTSNSVIYENVNPPTDWKEFKYLFDGDQWRLNPQWNILVSNLQNPSY